MRIVFFGTPEFAVASLDQLVKAGYEVAAVVTMPDRKGGRGNKTIESDVKKYAVDNNLKILQPEKLRNEEFLEELRSINADLFIVIAFRMLPKVVWEMPRLGCFNLHASLLPQLRGAAPINHAIINGFKETGVTTFMINEEIDKGSILMNASLTIGENEDAGSLHDRLMTLGSKLTVETVRLLEKGEIKPTPQPEIEKLYPAPKIFKQDCHINFNQSASTIHDKVRGLSPYPGGWAVLEVEKDNILEVKILQTSTGPGLPDDVNLTAGETLTRNNRFYVGTQDGTIEILSLQPAGKRRMTAEAFLAGHKPKKFLA